jgi:hypothetical protein
MVKWIGIAATAAVLAAAFFLLPAERVPEVVYEAGTVSCGRGWDAWRTDRVGEVHHYKSGLRKAVEGRIKWLGIYDFTVC